MAAYDAAPAGKAADRGATTDGNRLFPAASGVFEPLFEAVSGDPDLESVLVDGAIVSVHQKASGAKGVISIRPLAVPAALRP